MTFQKSVFSYFINIYWIPKFTALFQKILDDFLALKQTKGMNEEACQHEKFSISGTQNGF